MSISEPQRLEPKDVNKLLDLIFANTRDSYKPFFKTFDIPFTGSKGEHREKLVEALKNGVVTERELVYLLDEIEEYGNQHVFVYDCLPIDLDKFKDEAFIYERLTQFNLQHLYNKRAALFLPTDPEISSVIHTDRELIIKWVQKKEFKVEIEKNMDWGTDRLTITYQIKTIRAINLFRLNLITGIAELFIRGETDTDSKYEKHKVIFEEKVEQLLGINIFPPIDLAIAIKTLGTNNNAEVTRRQAKWQTQHGSSMNFISPEISADYLSDTRVAGILSDGHNELKGLLGNFYWVEDGNILKVKFHAKLFANLSKVYISGQKSREEVDHVLSRIRYHCRTT